LNLADGRYFSLPGVAAVTWRDLVAGHAPETLMEAAATARPDLSPALAGLLFAIISAGLLRAAPDARASAAAPRLASAIADATEVPAFAAYDEMAELILADPIHDVEEDVGWPALRKPPSRV